MLDIDAEATNAPSNLTFDEFRSFQNRERAARETANVKKGSTDDKKKKDGKKTGTGNKSTSQQVQQDMNKDVNDGNSSFGEFLEMPQVQSFVVTLLVLDIFSVLAQLLLSQFLASSGNESVFDANVTMRRMNTEIPINPVDMTGGDNILLFGFLPLSILSSGLNTFSGVSLVFFAFEIGAVLVVFRASFTSHWGYLLDAGIVGSQLYGELVGWGMQSRMLSIFRFWRLMRLLAYMINIEKEAHGETQELLKDKEAEIRRYTGEVRRFEVELSKEKDAKIAIEEMLASYKEEVDTLNEALKIAAMDIAEVAEADDDLLSDDEEDLVAAMQDQGLHRDHDSFNVEIDANLDGFVDAPSSRYDKAKNKADMIREVRRDKDDISIASDSTLTSRTNKSQTTTFVVNEDGTYDKKM